VGAGERPGAGAGDGLGAGDGDGDGPATGDGAGALATGVAAGSLPPPPHPAKINPITETVTMLRAVVFFMAALVRVFRRKVRFN
jgi:hypothetical protein